jgi:hypothetical protein
MRLSVVPSTIAFATTIGCGTPAEPVASPDEWLTVIAAGLPIHAVRADSTLAHFVGDAIQDGETLATGFFTVGPLQPFAISIYPDRASLTEHWRAAWQQSSFEAPCWLIAAAWASELDLLSPRVWSRDACGHDANNQTHIRNVLAHEVVHVLHAQVGQHPNLGTLLNAQWFTEGLATYVSGMLDVDYAGVVESRLGAGYAPTTLAEVWNDQANYPLSASIVRYIDQRYGPAALRDLLPARSTTAILTRLGVAETHLLTAWRADASIRVTVTID